MCRGWVGRLVGRYTYVGGWVYNRHGNPVIADYKLFTHCWYVCARGVFLCVCVCCSVLTPIPSKQKCDVAVRSCSDRYIMLEMTLT